MDAVNQQQVPALRLLTQSENGLPINTIVDDKNKVVCYSGERVCDIKDIDEKKFEGIETFKVQKCISGVLIRLFFHNGVWNLATNRRINAYDAYWFGCNVSFGDLFDDVDINYTLFDPKYTYVFIMRHPDICELIQIAEPIIYFISRYNNETFEEDMTPEFSFSKKAEIFEIDSIKCLKILAEMESHNEPGYIVKLGNKRIKIQSPKYGRALELRGGNPSLYCRYLELRNTNFREEFTEYYVQCIRIEKIICNMIKTLHLVYHTRYIKKEHIKVFQEFNWIINKLHELYIHRKKVRSENNPERVCDRITYDDIYDLFEQLSPAELITMYNKFVCYGIIVPPEIV